MVRQREAKLLRLPPSLEPAEPLLTLLPARRVDPRLGDDGEPLAALHDACTAQ